MFWGSLLAGGAQLQSGGVGIEGSESSTLANATLSATGVLALSGSVAATLGTLTGASTSAINVAGQLGATLAALTVAATGTSAPPVHTFTEAEVAFGFFGFFDLTNTSSTRRLWYTHQSSWTGYITGTDCTISSTSSIPLSISVDGGAEVSPTSSGGQVAVFSGLSDTAHLVRIRGYDFSSGLGYTSRTGALFTVTGSAPAIDQGSDLGTAWLVTDPAFPGMDSHARAAHPGGASVTPDIQNTTYVGPSSPYSNGGATQFRAQCDSIWIYTGDSSAWLSTDDDFPVEHALTPDLGQVRAWKKVTSGLDNTAMHDYTLVGSNFGSRPSMMGVMIAGSGSSFGTLSTRKRIQIFGDSITFAGGQYGDQETGCGDIYKVGAALTMLPGASGQSGKTTAGLATDLPTILAALPAPPDIALLAIGRNDVATAQAAFKASYQTCIEELLSGGARRVLCRGIVPDSTGIMGTRTADIAAVVTAMANPRVAFINTAGWLPISAPDNTHPDEQGYVDLANFEIPAIEPYADEEFGAQAGTLADASLSAAGALALHATASIALGALTGSGTGALVDPYSGSVNGTLANATLSAAGTLSLTGSIVVTLADLGITAAGGDGEEPVVPSYARIPAGAVRRDYSRRPAALSTARRRN